MNTEQLRADFEAWTDNHYYLSELNNIYLDDDYVDPEMQAAWEAYQAGRAALQSQDREDADLREALFLALEYWADRQQRYKNRSPVWVQKARAALGIDHARRVEGEL